MSLREIQLRTAKPRERPYKLYDSGGLFLQVTPSGGKLWRLRFVREGREKCLALGAYPEVGLAQARRSRDRAHEQLDEGIDPTVERRRQKLVATEAQALTFKVAAKAWHDNRLHEWTPAYATQIWKRLEDDIFPHIGERPIEEIEPKEMLAVLKKVEARGVLETTRRLKQYSSAIFRFAIASDFCKHDPAAPLKGALKAPPRPKHHKALGRGEIGDFLIRLAAYDGESETRIAILLALLMVPRTTELRAAKWSEFEAWRESFDEALWRIPGERMKMDDPHMVPMSRQACEALRELHTITGKSAYLFPSHSREGFMSNNTMLYGLYRLGFHGRTTTHGFRRMFSTEANEHGWKEDWIERQLAHDERDRIRAAYNAAQYLPQRREMLQWWADILDELRAQEKRRAAATSVQG
ncbi:MAG: integrase arm-type DNA-binding domain-containing protein [Proteobacteria bacterium]|nr:integrase arm-type DNA-binding domain-containing protein [Pseudomonadota bacterium]